MTKLEILKNDIKKFGKLANDVLGEKAVAITIKSPYMSAREIDEAVEFCKIYNIKHEILELGILEDITDNPKDRCYICKKSVFAQLMKRACELGFTNIADGTNADDLGEYRPGLKAKDELGVLSPLKNLSKVDIRELSRELNLPTHDKPSYACLLTRLPHGHKFNPSDLALIEKVENLLIKNGYKNIRARFDGKSIKLQMSGIDMARFTADDKFKPIIKEINAMGELQILLDLKGLREEILK